LSPDQACTLLDPFCSGGTLWSLLRSFFEGFFGQVTGFFCDLSGRVPLGRFFAVPLLTKASPLLLTLYQSFELFMFGNSVWAARRDYLSLISLEASESNLVPLRGRLRRTTLLPTFCSSECPFRVFFSTSLHVSFHRLSPPTGDVFRLSGSNLVFDPLWSFRFFPFFPLSLSSSSFFFFSGARVGLNFPRTCGA